MAIRRTVVSMWAGVAILVVAGAGAAVGQAAAHAGGTFVDATGSTVGWVRLVEDGAGTVHVNVHVAGLTPGLHGIHIHAIAACGPTFAAAGPHYNPLGAQHGLANTTTSTVTIKVGPTTLFDQTAAAVGSSFIIHAAEDDQLTDATNGNSGARVACAVIEAQ
jgi:Cu-Zn family superoxide dismutase